VAKSANIVALRVLDCQGSGSISDTVAGACVLQMTSFQIVCSVTQKKLAKAVSLTAGLEWVADNHDGPSVVIMSLVCNTTCQLAYNLAPY
jgi:hypothetical protein